MRHYKNELDVDFIGSDKPLTKEEGKAVSEYIKAGKLKRAKAKASKPKPRPHTQPA
jgi:hypothetical protein